MSLQIQWEDCRWADVTSACWTQLVLLQGGTLSNRNKHPLCWGQTWQGPSQKGQNLQRLCPCPRSPHSRPPCPTERQGTRARGPGRCGPWNMPASQFLSTSVFPASAPNPL